MPSQRVGIAAICFIGFLAAMAAMNAYNHHDLSKRATTAMTQAGYRDIKIIGMEDWHNCPLLNQPEGVINTYRAEFRATATGPDNVNTIVLVCADSNYPAKIVGTKRLIPIGRGGLFLKKQ